MALVNRETTATPKTPSRYFFPLPGLGASPEFDPGFGLLGFDSFVLGFGLLGFGLLVLGFGFGLLGFGFAIFTPSLMCADNRRNSRTTAHARRVL